MKLGCSRTKSRYLPGCAIDPYPFQFCSFLDLLLKQRQSFYSLSDRPSPIAMGQFLDYLASVFTNKLEPNKDHESSNHVSENSFTRAFTKSDSERSAKLACLGQSNRKTMYLYESIASLAFLANLSMVVIPKLQSEAFKYLEPEGWQLATLTLVPLAIYIASISAMNEINKPILEGSKLTDKNSGLDLNKNDFVHSLKVVILLMAMCQLSSILSDQLLWSTIVIVSRHSSRPNFHL